MGLTAHQQVYREIRLLALAEAGDTHAEGRRSAMWDASASRLALGMARTESYVRRTLTGMLKAKLVKRTNETPGVYSCAYAMLPEDLQAIANMIDVYGVDSVTAWVYRAEAQSIVALGQSVTAPEQASEETSP